MSNHDMSASLPKSVAPVLEYAVEMVSNKKGNLHNRLVIKLSGSEEALGKKSRHDMVTVNGTPLTISNAFSQFCNWLSNLINNNTQITRIDVGDKHIDVTEKSFLHFVEHQSKEIDPKGTKNRTTEEKFKAVAESLFNQAKAVRHAPASAPAAPKKATGRK